MRVSSERRIAALPEGLANYLDVLDSQRQLFTAQIALTGHAQLVAVIQLYKALEGGWSPEVAAR